MVSCLSSGARCRQTGWWQSVVMIFHLLVFFFSFIPFLHIVRGYLLKIPPSPQKAFYSCHLAPRARFADRYIHPSQAPISLPLRAARHAPSSALMKANLGIVVARGCVSFKARIWRGSARLWHKVSPATRHLRRRRRRRQEVWLTWEPPPS